MGEKQAALTSRGSPGLNWTNQSLRGQENSAPPHGQGSRRPRGTAGKERLVGPGAIGITLCMPTEVIFLGGASLRHVQEDLQRLN